MNGFVFLTSSFLQYPNVLVGFEYHFSKNRFVIDELHFSKSPFSEGVHICDDDLLDALTKAIRKDCRYCDIYFANEDTGEISHL